MKRRVQFLLSLSPVVLFAIVAMGACASHEAETDQDTLPTSEETAEAASAITVSGYGHYCSMTWPGGGWGFASDTNGNDPCGWLTSQIGSGGTIQRAGIYHASSTNTAIARCTDGTVWLFRGEGNGPLTAAHDAADGRPGCIFTVAPHSLPIFNNPLAATPTWVNGFDFARGYTLNVQDFGQSGPTNASTVNFRGDDRSFADGHDAYDWNVPEGTKIKAVADGQVIATRDFDTNCDEPSNGCAGCKGSLSPIQGEVYIRHTISRSPGTYNEQFVSGYFHLKNRASLTVGQTVLAGAELGEASWVGCSSESHLHFAVFRTTNIASARFANFMVPGGQANNGGAWTIDPYGWQAPLNVDPWGWRGYPDGALSINLWKSGQAPPLGSWGP